MNWLRTYKSFLLLLFSALIAQLLIIESGMCFYENGTNNFAKIMVSGALLGEPSPIPTPIAVHVWVSKAYAALYKWTPQISWFDITSVLYSIISFILTAFVLFSVLNKGKGTAKIPSAPIVQVGILTIAMSLQNMQFIEFTRASMIIGFMSCLIIMSFKALNIWQLLLLNGLVVLSMMIRPDGFAIALAMLIPFPFLIGNWKKIIRIIPAIAAFGFLIYGLNHPSDRHDSNYLVLRPYQLTAFDLSVPLIRPNFANQTDSMAVVAVKSAFLNDSGIITHQVLGKYIPAMDKTLGHVENYVSKNSYSVNQLRKKISHIEPSMILLAIIPFMLLLAFSLANKKFPYRVAVYVIYGWSLIIGITLAYKMELHVLYPMTVCFFTMSALISTNYVQNFSKLFLVLSCIFLVANISQWNNWSKSDDPQYVKRIIDLNNEITANPDKYDKVTFVYNLKSLVSTNSIPFGNSDGIQDNAFSFDNGFLFFSDQYETKSLQMFGSVQTASIMKSILDESDRYFFVSSESRMAFFQDYFRTVYHVDFEFKKITSFSNNESNKLPEIIKIFPSDAN